MSQVIVVNSNLKIANNLCDILEIEILQLLKQVVITQNLIF
jgi:hypothetical protein